MKKKYYRIFNDIYLKEIPLDINDKYNKNNNNINKNLFTILNNNNNGIISDKSIFLKSYNKFTGGKKITGGKNIDKIDFSKELIEYSKGYRNINKDGSFDHDEYINENMYMKKFIDNHFTFNDTELTDVIPERLAEFIRNNTKDTPDYLQINLNNKYTYNMNAVHSYDNKYNIKLHFDHMGYNEDIVKAFENDFIKNEEKRQKFIADQNSFIDALPRRDKIIINDYTKKEVLYFTVII